MFGVGVEHREGKMVRKWIAVVVVVVVSMDEMSGGYVLRVDR